MNRGIHVFRSATIFTTEKHIQFSDINVYSKARVVAQSLKSSDLASGSINFSRNFNYFFRRASKSS